MNTGKFQQCHTVYGISPHPLVMEPFNQWHLLEPAEFNLVCSLSTPGHSQTFVRGPTFKDPQDQNCVQNNSKTLFVFFPMLTFAVMLQKQGMLQKQFYLRMSLMKPGKY